MIAAVILSFLYFGQALKWEQVTGYPGEGRHHPITFANETHGFLLTGSTFTSTVTSDFYMYHETTDEWTDISITSAFPGEPRGYGYGVVLPVGTKAFLGFGADANNQILGDLWEFDMETHEWRRLADLPGLGRRHPAMVPVYNTEKEDWEIHVGLGDGLGGNYNDWWSYSLSLDAWERMPDFPSSRRHHPFYFYLLNNSYAGLGHSDGFDPYIERDWYRFDTASRTWHREADFESYQVDQDSMTVTKATGLPVTTEARVAGTQFSIEFEANDVSKLSGSLGFVLSGDGDDHSFMETGEFHAFYPTEGGWWRELPPHPGFSRWAPGSFVMRGTARVYFTSGYDRVLRTLFSDMWKIDLTPLFQQESETTSSNTSNPTAAPTGSGAALTSGICLPVVTILSIWFWS
jgi:hypothetical protein